MSDAVTMVPNPFGMPAPAEKSDPWAQFPDAQQPASQAASGGNDPWSQFPDAPKQSDPWAQFPDAGQTSVSKTGTGTGPALSDASFKSDPSKGMIIDPAHLDRFLNGIYKGYSGVDQFLGHAWGGDWAKGADARAQEIERQGNELSKHAGLTPDRTDWWNVAGNVLSPINFAGGEGLVAGARALPLVGRAVEGSNILKGALQGTGIAAAQPVTGDGDYASQKASQLATGAVTGGVAAPVMGAVGSAVKPVFADAVQTLLNEGVRLTPGQIMGGGAKRIEDIAQSFPLVGQWVRDARATAMEDFNTAAANRALAPIGEKVPETVGVGHGLAEHVEDRIGAAYNRVLPNVSLSIDRGLMQDLGRITQAAQAGLPDAQQDQLQRVLRTQITGKLAQAGGTAPGNIVQSITSELGSEMKGYLGDMSFDNRKLGRALADVRTAVSSALERQNPQYAQQLRTANEAWEQFSKVRAAAAHPAAIQGQFTPNQLQRAAMKGEAIGTKAKGQAVMQDLAEAGKQVLPSKVADSGTPERAALMGIATHGLGYGLLGPGSLVPGAALAALYNPIGQRIARAALTARPAGAQALRNILQQYAPATAGRLPLLNGDK